MKLGLAQEYAKLRLEIPLERIVHTESLVFHSVWSAEAYGSDAITPLAYLAGRTQCIRLGISRRT